MFNYESPTGNILVNFSDKTEFGVSSSSEIEACEAAIKLIIGFSQRIPLTNKVTAAIDLLIDSGTCFFPEFFLTNPGVRMNKRIPERFVTETTFGLSMVEALERAGLFAKIEKREKSYPGYFRGQVFRVMAAITMMFVGVDDIDDLPRAALTDVLDHFRTPDGLRWRTGLLTSEEISVTCFREITRALGTHFNDTVLFDKAPQTRISHKGSSSWQFILANPTDLQKDLLRLHAKYSEISKGRPTHDRQIIMDFDKFISGLGFESVHDAFASPVPDNAMADFYINRLGSATAYTFNAIRSAKRLSDFILRELAQDEPNGIFYPLVTELELKYVENKLGNSEKKSMQTTSRALPERFHFLAKQILDEGAEGWPGRTFTAEVFHDGKITQVYCPIIPTLLRGAFEIPLRIVQFRRLDSGEGDLKRFNGKTMSWEANVCPNAGFWQKKLSQKKGNLETRGYAYEFSADEGSITGIFVNTNKTGLPYTIPWMSQVVLSTFWELAEWQLTYNSVDRPATPEQYRDREMPKASLRGLPDIFALFRAMPSGKRSTPGIPVSHNMVVDAFNLLLLETERRWNILNPENEVSLILRYNKVTKQPDLAAYTLHGLRVRGITNLYKAGIPIEILSKIVAGHATVVMTLYYLLLEPAEIHARLTAAMNASKSTEVSQFADELKSMTIAEAKKRSTYIQEDAVDAIFRNPDKNTFCNVDVGICPYDGTRCHDGGEALRNEKSKKGGTDKTVYGPVRGGPRNCIMCRHFVSGTPFILQLELFGSLLLWRRRALAEAQNDHRARLRELYEQKATGQISPAAFRSMSDRIRAENNDLKDQIEDVDNAIFNVKLHLDAASKILKNSLSKGETPSVALVANDSHSAVGFIERTPFEMAAILTTASQFWSILRDDKLEQLKRQTIDQVMFNSGEAPISLRADLSHQQRQAAADAAAGFLLQRVSRADQQLLIEGKKSLADLDLQTGFRSLIDQVILQQVPLHKAMPLSMGAM
jgi:hypothetical protein